MRTRTMLLAVAALPFALAGCTAAAPGTAGTASPTPTGTPWLRYAGGSPTSTAGPSYGGASRSPALPRVSFLPAGPSCAAIYPSAGPVLIPLTVTPGKGTLSVTWPRQYDSAYRVTAVPQPLISGSQPPYTWQNVPAGTGCTVSATISGLKAGVPYVVWLDAPGSGHERDGTRHLYSGRSGVVYPG